MPVTYASSGSLLLDAALGGGYRRGQITSIWGKPESMAVPVAVLAAQEAQRRSGSILWVSTMPLMVEGILDLPTCHLAGVENFKGILRNVAQEALDVLVIDSLDGIGDSTSVGLDQWRVQMDALYQLAVDVRPPYTAVVITRLMHDFLKRPYVIPREQALVVSEKGEVDIYVLGSSAVSHTVQLPWRENGDFNDVEDFLIASKTTGPTATWARKHPERVRGLRLRVLDEMFRQR